MLYVNPISVKLEGKKETSYISTRVRTSQEKKSSFNVNWIFTLLVLKLQGEGESPGEFVNIDSELLFPDIVISVSLWWRSAALSSPSCTTKHPNMFAMTIPTHSEVETKS